jgi:hypothetical protein
VAISAVTWSRPAPTRLSRPRRPKNRVWLGHLRYREARELRRFRVQGNAASEIATNWLEFQSDLTPPATY